jgi:hypothetical protein
VEALPSHFRSERRCLERAGLADWALLAAVDDAGLRRLARDGASEQRLIRLRGQARLVVELGLRPEEAALLLHAGIATAAGLAEASPERLLLQVGRLQRSLAGTALPPPTPAVVRGWIATARLRSGRSAN